MKRDYVYVDFKDIGKIVRKNKDRTIEFEIFGDDPYFERFRKATIRKDDEGEYFNLKLLLTGGEWMTCPDNPRLFAVDSKTTEVTSDQVACTYSGKFKEGADFYITLGRGRVKTCSSGRVKKDARGNLYLTCRAYL